jgi:drug/metabolite transporter (DMT)-like permease
VRPEYLLLVVSTVVWGGLHPISKLLLLSGLTPSHIALARMAFAALTVFLVALLSGRLARLRRHRPRELLSVAAIGLAGYFVSIFLSLNGLTYLPAATNSLLANTSPLFVALFSPLVLRERPSRRALLGLAAGFAGVAILAGSRESAAGEVVLLGVLLSLTAAATWALYTALGRWSTARLDPVLVTLISAAVSTPPLLAVAALEGRLDLLAAAEPLAWAGLAWLGVIGTGLTFLIWTAALRRLKAASVAVFSYLIPVFAVLFSWLILGEQPTPAFLLGAALVLVGVAAAQR